MSTEKKVYFDNAATTPMRPEVKEAMIASFASFGNPSSIHSFGRASKVLIEKARKNIAKELGVTASEIIFTSGGTEAINMIHKGLRYHSDYYFSYRASCGIAYLTIY